MKYFLIIACLALVQNCTSVPFENKDGKSNDDLTKASDPGYRLPKDQFQAIQYDIFLIAYFQETPDRSFTFDGSVAITVKALQENITTIVLHSKNLNITDKNVNVVHKNGITIPRSGLLEFNETYEFLKIKLNQSLIKNNEYRINILNYEGVMANDMKGFYKSYYMEGGKKKWLGTTQFQPVHARKVFPCFDEPSYKAVFNLQIQRPSYMKTTLSNMPIFQQNVNTATNMTTDTFYNTPKMSTYLLAFIVSEFTSPNYNDTEKFGVWARPEAGSQSKYAFDTGRKIVAKMGEFLNSNYYSMDKYMKMDQAAIPDFSAGAMENWGLLTYREAYLMFDDKESSARYKQQISTVLAHEITHMWFGDLVTCHWWSDTWLNEGFARFFQYELSDMIGENMDLEDQFLVVQLQAAFQADTSANSNPLTNPNVNSPDEISGHFGTISYNKGASVIKMIKYWIGESTFQKGLRYHVANNTYSTKTPDDLFNRLQQAADEDGSIQKYNKTVKEVMESWTSQNGYPLVTVTVNMTTGDVTLTQEKFTREGVKPDARLYKIPITFTNNSKLSFDDTKPDFIMTEKTMKFNKGASGHGYVILNKKARGYYRVNYDSHTWDMIKDTLMKEHKNIDRLNRAQMVDDLFNLAREGVIEYDKMYGVLEYLTNETDYAPWTAGYSGFKFLRDRFAQIPATHALLEKHLTNLMANAIKSVGLQENTNDKHLTKLFRSSTLKLACDLGHVECINDSKNRFNLLMNSSTIVPANLREHVYCAALRNGTGKEFDYLWQKYLKSNVVNEQIVILNALGCTREDEKIYLFLNQTIEEDSPIRDQDLMTAYNSPLNGNQENANVVLKFVMENLQKMKESYSTANLNSAISGLTNKLSESKLKDFEEFIDKSPILTADEKKLFKSSIESSINDLKWAADRNAKVSKWLDSKYNSAASVMVSITLVVSSLIFIFFNNNYS